MTLGMCREFDAHPRTASLVRIQDLESSAMAARDFFDDRQAQAAALTIASGRAIEAFAHAFAFGERDAGAAVFHFKIR